jgi:drug/metabolite transporter (DMT)-like permease
MKEPEEKVAKTEEEESTDKVIVIIMCITTTVVSVSMVLLNKAIVLSVPFSGGLVLLQNTATILLVQSYRGCHAPKDIGWQAIRDATPCALLFGITTFTSMTTLTYLSVTAFTILKNTQSILSYPLDYYMRGEQLKPVSIYLLFTILLGTCAYCGRDLRANINGLFWVLAHLIFSTVYAVLMKMRLQAADDTNDKLTQALDLSWYNNALSTPIVAGAAALQAFTLREPPIKAACGLHCWIMIAISCFGGCAMSVISIRTQGLMSPVTFLVFNNLNKIPAILISTALWPHLETANTTQEIMGIVLSLYGGFLFSLSKQGDVNPVALFITTALNIAIIPLMILGELAEQHSAQVLNITAVNT